MIKSIKELKREMDARVKADEVERDEEGRAVLEMCVRSDEYFLSDYSVGKKPAVDEDVAEFLEESARALRPKEPLTVKIYSDCIEEGEEKAYSSALTEYYVRHYKQISRELWQNFVVSLVMALVGLVALAVGVTFTVLERHPVVSEALDIFAWVFLWEAVDLFFLERSVLRMKRTRCLQFIGADILFFPLSKASEN